MLYKVFIVLGVLFSAGAHASQISQKTLADCKAACNVYLGEMCLLGQGGACDYQKARSYFLMAFAQNKDTLSKIQAEMRLGEMCLFGKGMAPDYQQARKYFELVALETENCKYTEIQASAHLYLGELSFGEGDVESALRYFRQVVTKTTNSQLSIHAHMYLGEIFYQFNMLIAKSYFEILTVQDENRAVQAHGYLRLGEMYLHGKLVDCNYLLAKIYLQTAARQNDNKGVRDEAQRRLQELAQLLQPPNQVEAIERLQQAAMAQVSTILAKQMSQENHPAKKQRTER